MSFFRRLDATSNPTVTAHAADTRDGETHTEYAAWIPAPEHPEIWAALAVLSSTPGVIDHTTAGLPAPAHHSEGEN